MSAIVCAAPSARHGDEALSSPDVVLSYGVRPPSQAMSTDAPGALARAQLCSQPCGCWQPTPEEFKIFTPLPGSPSMTPAATPHLDFRGCQQSGGDDRQALAAATAAAPAAPPGETAPRAESVAEEEPGEDVDAEVPKQLAEVIAQQDALIEGLLSRCRALEAHCASQNQKLTESEKAKQEAQALKSKLEADIEALEAASCTENIALKTVLSQLHGDLKMELESVRPMASYSAGAPISTARTALLALRKNQRVKRISAPGVQTPCEGKGRVVLSGGHCRMASGSMSSVGSAISTAPTTNPGSASSLGGCSSSGRCSAAAAAAALANAASGADSSVPSPEATPRRPHVLTGARAKYGGPPPSSSSTPRGTGSRYTGRLPAARTTIFDQMPTPPSASPSRARQRGGSPASQQARSSSPGARARPVPGGPGLSEAARSLVARSRQQERQEEQLRGQSPGSHRFRFTPRSVSPPTFEAPASGSAGSTGVPESQRPALSARGPRRAGEGQQRRGTGSPQPPQPGSPGARCRTAAEAPEARPGGPYRTKTFTGSMLQQQQQQQRQQQLLHGELTPRSPPRGLLASHGTAVSGVGGLGSPRAGPWSGVPAASLMGVGPSKAWPAYSTPPIVSHPSRGPGGSLIVMRGPALVTPGHLRGSRHLAGLQTG